MRSRHYELSASSLACIARRCAAAAAAAATAATHRRLWFCSRRHHGSSPPPAPRMLRTGTLPCEAGGRCCGRRQPQCHSGLRSVFSVCRDFNRVLQNGYAEILGQTQELRANNWKFRVQAHLPLLCQSALRWALCYMELVSINTPGARDSPVPCTLSPAALPRWHRRLRRSKSCFESMERSPWACTLPSTPRSLRVRTDPLPWAPLDACKDQRRVQGRHWTRRRPCGWQQRSPAAAATHRCRHRRPPPPPPPLAPLTSFARLLL